MDHQGYPRPQLVRPDWRSLNGKWDFAVDREGVWRTPSQVRWSGAIEVPFAPETPASGIGRTDFFNACWYKRDFDLDREREDQTVLLHFGAVDHSATVWVNGAVAVRHEGGYTPFHADITEWLVRGRKQEIIVCAADDPTDLAKPRGKQDWQLEPHSIWYLRTTGIWQTVWVETVGRNYIDSLRWAASLDRWEIDFQATIAGQIADDLRLHVRLKSEGQLLADDTYRVIAGEVHRRIAFSDPGIDDHRNTLLWSPECPTLIEAELELATSAGAVLDHVQSYTALRTVGVQGDCFVLNGRPYPLRLVLDQGYWPQSGLTAPDDDAYRKDVELAKAMGFNGVRKHQKVEDPRYLYWADRLGLLVWEEMPSAYRFTSLSVGRVTREWIEVLERDASHPCVVAWVPFNESWGVPDLTTIPAQQSYVQALYHLTKTIDPTRPIVGNDGWESVATDIVGIHDYDADPARLARRYRGPEAVPQLMQRERPGGRVLAVAGHAHEGQPLMLTEFGGIALSRNAEETWGYSRARDAHDLAERYRTLLETVRGLGALAGFCYTQFADTYQEANGLLEADRTPKFPLSEIALATRGPRTPR